MTSYLYWPVSGAIVFWREPYSIRKAKATLPALRKEWPAVEIERVMLLNNDARRYWRWRKGQWSFNDHFDPTPVDLMHWNEGGVHGCPSA